MASIQAANHLLKHKIRDLLVQDPGTPRKNPTLSYWQQPTHPRVSTIRSKVLPSKTDVVVIGSGITGCSVTKSLLEDSSLGEIHITVLEARTLTSGATGRNGGHLVSGAALYFSGFVSSYGLEAAKVMARFSFSNLERIKQIAEGMPQNIRKASEVREVEEITVLAEDELMDDVKESLAMLEEALPEVQNHHRLIGPEELRKEWGIIGAVGGITQTSAACWPYRLITSLWDSLLTTYPRRLSIETNTPVLEVTETRTSNVHDYPYKVRTTRGTVEARRVVYCSNGHTGHLLPRLRGKLYPFRGHVTTQAPGPDFPKPRRNRSYSMIIKSKLDPFTEQMHWGLYYCQQNAQTKDIFIGCENQTVSDSICADDTYISDLALGDLPNFLPRMFSAARDAKPGAKPKLKAIWSGVMGMTADGLPLVGRLPESVTGRTSGEEWIAGGFNGEGMDKCWLSGESLAAMIAGRPVSTGMPEGYKINQERVDNDMSITKIIDFFTKWAADSMDTATKEKPASSVQTHDLSPHETVYRLRKL